VLVVAPGTVAALRSRFSRLLTLFNRPQPTPPVARMEARRSSLSGAGTGSEGALADPRPGGNCGGGPPAADIGGGGGGGGGALLKGNGGGGGGGPGGPTEGGPAGGTGLAVNGSGGADKILRWLRSEGGRGGADDSVGPFGVLGGSGGGATKAGQFACVVCGSLDARGGGGGTETLWVGRRCPGGT
jgi:hypothetical protein